MSDRRAPLAALPFWPRHLSREEAARYVGVCPDVFDAEVAQGLWPAARRRGDRGGRLTWDRMVLDACSDRDAGLDQPEAQPAHRAGAWGAGNAKAPPHRPERKPQKAA